MYMVFERMTELGGPGAGCSQFVDTPEKVALLVATIMSRDFDQIRIEKMRPEDLEEPECN